MKSIIKWGIKKASKTYIKKKMREDSDIVDEIFRWGTLNPFDAKDTNRGEKEYFDSLDKEKKIIEEKRIKEFQENQTKIPDEQKNNYQKIMLAIEKNNYPRC